MEFIPGSEVMWHGEPADVVEVRGDRVALTRLRDQQTILTTVHLLRIEQPTPLQTLRSLLGPM